MSVIIFTLTFSFSANGLFYEVKDVGGGDIRTNDGNLELTNGGNQKDVSYVSDWELYAYFNNANAIMRFGFDDFWTNEDYLYTYNSKASHHGGVKNDLYSEEKTAQTDAGKWSSKVDIVHAAHPVWHLYY